ncbi:MAG: small multi-drug export protein [Candidatus Aenigmarchaeota archaeon]|nr:small multi-drug export protein [Candidatus Aenigmarchaeota archaeon]
MEAILSVIITTLLPIAELRGGIPLGVALGVNPWLLLPIIIIFNTLIFFPTYFIFDFVYERFEHIEWVRRKRESIHLKGQKYVEKYGILGIALFVGIPAPFTGAYTGTIAARLLELDWKRSLLAVFIGVLIATAIVTIIVYGFLSGFALVNGG